MVPVPDRLEAPPTSASRRFLQRRRRNTSPVRMSRRLAHTGDIRSIVFAAFTVFVAVFVGGMQQPAQAKTAKTAQPSVPVLIPKIVEDAACVLGKVNVSTFASIRTAPKPDAKELDRLNTETLVQMCDSRGAWTGVVYGTNTGSCVPDVMAKAFNYKGPCKSGWIATRLTTVVAG
jgi:hypothetical protein